MKAFIKRFSSLRLWMLMVITICWLAPTLLLGTYMGTRFFTALQEKTESLLTTMAEHALVRTMENIDAVVTLAKDVIYDDELSSAVANYESNEITYEAYFSQCRSYLERKFGRERLVDFALFFRTRNVTTIFFTSDDYEEAVYFQNNVLGRAMRISETLDTKNSFFSYDDRMYMIRNLYNTKMEKYGVMVLGLNEARLFAPATEACGESGMDVMISLGDYTVGSTDYASAVSGMSEQGDTLLYTLDGDSRDYAMRFQIQADKREVYREMDTYRRLMASMFLLLAPIILVSLWFVNRRIVRPIRLLSEAASRIANGELGATVPMHGNDELGQLGCMFSSMSLRLKFLVEKSYKEEIALRDARIQAMQSRINSHFLNNALETINWEARMEGSNSISEMVEALSCLLNAAMDRNEQHLVPLHEELVVADAYFYFIGLRFGERLTVWQHIDEELGSVLVPRLAIQTLVENAIEHGIAPMGGGRIVLTIFEREGRLTIEVVNTGKKLSEEDLARIRLLMSDEENAEGHMGIRNVAHRLRLLYGTNAVLTIKADERGQTVAAFTIPAVYAKEENNDSDVLSKP